MAGLMCPTRLSPPHTDQSQHSGGSVQFSDGATPLGSGALNQGQASFTTTALVPGSHVIAATYGGASASMGQFVYGVPSTVTFTARSHLGCWDPAPPQGIAAPTGQVVFRNNGSDLGSAPVAAGTAVLQAVLAPGTHQLAALYTDDKNWAAGQSATATVTVGVAPTTTTLTGANQIVLTASVATSAQGVGMPTGSVQFMDTGKNAAVGAATPSDGTGRARRRTR